MSSSGAQTRSCGKQLFSRLQASPRLSNPKCSTYNYERYIHPTPSHTNLYIKPSQSTPLYQHLSRSLFKSDMEKDTDDARTFDMDALRTNLPQKRGLSRYYSGKSRTFECMADVRCLEDLKKQEHPDAKKRKKYSDRRKGIHISPYSCGRISGGTHSAPPFVTSVTK